MELCLRAESLLLALMVWANELYVVFPKHLLGQSVAEIGGGNYTYTQVKRKGRLLVMLDSLSGDADLYVSDKTTTPDYSNYELQSFTCGRDEVVIPSSMKRPVTIGIYGHPSVELSTFEISIYLLENDPEYDTDQSYHTEKEQEEATMYDDSESSPAWEIFWTIIKIILEILL